MIATITSTVFSTIIPALAEVFDTPFTEYCDEYTVRLPERIGSGYIRGIDFDHGLGISEWNVRCGEKGEILFNTEEAPPLMMIFGVEGDIAVTIDSSEVERIGPLQGLMVAVRRGSWLKLSWNEGEAVRFNILIAGRARLLDSVECYLHSAPERLAEAFRDITGHEQFLYRSDYSTGIAEAIHEVNRYDLTGISSTFFLKAKAWEILALMIRQYFDGAEGTNHSYRNTLRSRDIDALRKARRLLIRDLQNPPTIEELAREVGLNRNKLQSGFKAVYGVTISRYLRDVRLRRAKMLLTEDSYSIAEVSDEIGYSNSSQFSRRFREKFGMLPSTYVSMIRRHRGVELDGHDPEPEEIEEKKDRTGQ